MAAATDIAIAARTEPAQGVRQMNRNLHPPHRVSRSLARPHDTEKDMWRGYLVVAGTALGLIGIWIALVLLSA